jgi:prephenate dehydrogenase
MSQGGRWLIAAAKMARRMKKQRLSENSSSPQWPNRVAVLGVGLLGGSVAKSLRRANPDIHLVAWARSGAKASALAESGIFNQVCDSIEQSVDQCDVVVVASPVSHIARLVHEAAVYSPNHCLITDVGSTKLRIAEAVDEDPAACGRFVAAHPIAGSEKTGIEHAQEDLFDQKLILLTPGSRVTTPWIEKATLFWRLTGGIIREMTPKDHDTHLAAISHVPHLVSSLVAKVAPRAARGLAGSGWNDITRVAAGDPQMWTAICQENRAAISQELQRVREEFARLQQIIDEADDAQLHDWLAEAQNIKNNPPSS